MSKFTKLLEYEHASESKKRKMLDNKELLLSEGTDSSTLLNVEINNLLLDGMESRRCMRDVLPIYKVDRHSAKISYGSKPNKYATYHAESADIPIYTEDYSSTTIPIKTAGTRPMITNEMIEDADFGIVEQEIRKAGARLENKLNQEAISVCLGGLTNSAQDPTDDVMNIGDAYETINDLGWQTNKVVLHPAAVRYLMSSQGYDLTTNLLGIESFVLDSETDNTSQYWDSTDSTNHYMGLVLDSTDFAAIAMKKDISFVEVDDPIHDLTGIVASIRFGVGILNADAAVGILTV